MQSSTLQIAWRNLGRNRKRTLLAISAIALGQFMIVFYAGFVKGMHDDWLGTITGPLVGHVQIHHEDWREERAVDLYIDRLAEATARLEALPKVTRVSARVYSAVLAASGEVSETPADAEPAMVVGVDVAMESRPGGILESLRSEYQPGEGEVVMGKVLARRLGVEAGDLVAVIGLDADEFPVSDLFTVTAVIKGQSDIVNRLGMVMALSSAQEFFSLPDQAHEILVYGEDPEEAEALAALIATDPHFAAAEVLPWREVVPDLVRIMKLQSMADFMMTVIVFLAVAAGIANTMMMSTFERTHEFGMLLALGSRPGRLVRMIVYEAIALGLIGVFIGSLVGTAVVLITSRTGLDFGALSGMGEQDVALLGLSVSYVFYPVLAFRPIMLGVVAAVMTAVAASAWPATIIARLEPVNAMRDQYYMGGLRHSTAPRLRETVLMASSVSGTYALRSLLGHPRRTVISAFGIGIGCAIGLILLSWFQGAFDMMVRAASDSGAGHLRVVSSEWPATRENTLRLHGWEEALAKVQANEAVEYAISRARVNGLLALGNRTVGVEILGVEPDAERASNRVISKSKIEGRYLREEDRGKVVIGKAIATRLDVELEDDLLVTLSGREGMQSAMLTIVGILESGGSEFDESLCHVVLADLAEITDYDKPGEITIFLKDRNSIDSIREVLAAQMPSNCEVITWREINQALSGTMEGKAKSMKFVSFLLLVLVTLGITSAQLTAVLQRRREYGLLMALGMKSRQLLSLIMIESGIMGLVGAMLALLLAVGPTYLLATKGFNIGLLIGDLSMMGVLLDPIWYGDFGWWLVPYALGVSLAATTTAAIYPAWFALKTDPADALRVT